MSEYLTRKEFIEELLKHGNDYTLIFRGDHTWDRMRVTHIELDHIQPYPDEEIAVPYILIE